MSGEPVGYENLLVRDNATGTYRLVNVTPPGVTPADAHFQAASADLSHVIFTETSPLAEGARYGVENLYEWDEGALRLVSVLPDGTAVPGSLAAKAGTPEHEGVVSSDGSHVLFTYGGALYDRIDGQRTVQVDEQQGGSGPSGGGSLQGRHRRRLEGLLPRRKQAHGRLDRGRRANLTCTSARCLKARANAN